MLRQTKPQLRIRDVAQRLSLSSCTVSKALSGQPGVRPHTRQRVIKAAKQLGYVLDRQAQTLRKGRSHTIGLLLPTLSNPVYSENMKDIYQAAAERGFEVMVTSYELNHDRRIALCRDMIGRRVEGIIIPWGAAQTPLPMLLEAGLAVLYFDPEEDAIPGAGVLKVDRIEGVRLLLRHLLDLGHRRPLLVGNWHLDPRRMKGIRSTLRQAGLLEDEFLLATEEVGDEVMRRGYEQTLKIFQADRRAATAIMASNDQGAIGAIAALHHLGLSVPGDVSVTGMDNIAAAEFSIPPLTTESRTHLRLGRHAVEMLIGMIQGEIPAGTGKTLSPRLVVRESTGTVSKQNLSKDSLTFSGGWA
jgi:LacI family transcriptional regulator